MIARVVDGALWGLVCGAVVAAGYVLVADWVDGLVVGLVVATGALLGAVAEGMVR